MESSHLGVSASELLRIVKIVYFMSVLWKS